MPSSTNPERKAPKVMVIGFDGATLELLRPWAEQGLLPTFQRLMKEGAWGELESTIPPVTPAAWSTMATGLNQGKHGIFDFYGRQEGSYDAYMVNATNRHGSTIWRLLGKAGYRSTVFNVPASYPPDPIEGTMVTGLLTPSNATDASYPREVLDELKEAVPGFSFYPPGIFSRGEEVKFVNDVLEWDQMTLKATEFLMDRDPADFVFTVFIGVDVVSHFMWREMVTKGAAAATDDPTERETLANAIQSVYQQADTILAQMLDTADEDTYVIVVSDHGFGPLDYYMHLNTWLVDKGYLKFKRTPEVRLKHLAYRLGLTPLRILETLRALGLGGKVKDSVSNRRDLVEAMVKRAFLSLDDVDWSQTTAFGVGFGGPIFVNLKGREPQGIVEPGAEYEALLKRLEADLRELRHPITGDPFVNQIFRREELYSGPYTELASDIMFAPHDLSNQGYGVHGFASNRWLEPTPDRNGTHRMNGILFMKGPGIEAGSEVEGASLCDIAPTVLALMGVPIPDNSDGQVLSAAFSPALRSQLTISYQEAEDERAEAIVAPEMSPEEEKQIRERLEALGYGG
ncbi:MAG: alkaline phosphatase family protein [Geodermatophilaceae bacterium]|nr:alkaline phosphatase family protein [Geodermatophilaceae bacterium]